MFDFLKKLTAGHRDAGEPVPDLADRVDHEGFEILPVPRKVPQGWRTEGIIRREVDGQIKSYHFIRADVLASRDDAKTFAVGKAKVIIAQQGLQIFDD